MDVVKISGIKCDNTEFDYRDDSVLFEDYHNWFNKPYPKCGENLLTEKDYNFTKTIVDKFNNFDIGFLTSENVDSTEMLGETETNELLETMKEIPNEKLAETLDIVYALLKQMGENN